jgi:hypothetical protein
METSVSASVPPEIDVPFPFPLPSKKFRFRFRSADFRFCFHIFILFPFFREKFPLHFHPYCIGRVAMVGRREETAAG